MRINWKVRFRNATWVTTFVAFIISTAYHAMAMFEIAPTITEDAVTRVAMAVVQLLSLMGVLIDPTTQGASDSDRAMTYDKPN